MQYHVFQAIIKIRSNVLQQEMQDLARIDGYKRTTWASVQLFIHL